MPRTPGRQRRPPARTLHWSALLIIGALLCAPTPAAARSLRARLFPPVPPPHDITAPPIPKPWPRAVAGQLHRAAHPKGAMLLLHGGFWYLTGAPADPTAAPLTTNQTPEPYWDYLPLPAPAGAVALPRADAIASEAPEARIWQRRGWTTYNADYAPGARSLAGAIRAYQHLRQAVGPRTPICVEGSSAGGQLALLLAARFNAIRCVIARAAPVDIRSLTGPVRVAADTYLVPDGGADYWSPAAHAKQITCPVLLSAAADDPIVAPSQSTGMARLLGHHVQVRILPAADSGPLWVHATVSQVAVRSYRRLERAVALDATQRDR